MTVGRLLSFWDGIFSGAMLNFQGVPKISQCQLEDWYNWYYIYISAFWNFGPLNWGLWFQQLYIDAYFLSENLRNTVWFDIWYDKFVYTRQTYMKVHDVECVFFSRDLSILLDPELPDFDRFALFQGCQSLPLGAPRWPWTAFPVPRSKLRGSCTSIFDCHAFVLLPSVGNKWWHVMAFRYKVCFGVLGRLWPYHP